MKQLSGLDATFLYLETPEMPMHVGALHLFELPPGTRSKFVTRLREHLASRLPITPVLRRRLWWMPLNMANPAWVDAEPDLKQHIVEIRLPKVAGRAAGMRELEAQVSALHPVLLDRSRPLWKFHVFEGLAPGPNGEKRVALYTQLHHAAVDGQAAVALANALLDTTAEPRAIDVKPSGRKRTFELDMTEMLRGVLGLQAQKVAAIVKNLPDTVGTLKDATVQALGSSSLLGGKGGSPGNLTLAPRTPMNVSVTRERAFATVTLPMHELRALGRVHGATVNDMVLAVCSGALRRYLARHRQLPKKSLVAAVPISLREKGDTTADNQASMSLISLGTHIADAGQRLAHIKAASGAMKSTMGSLKRILPTDFPSLGVPWLMEAAASLYGKARVADRIPQVANVVISNVPGPPVALYMAGARMLTNYPASIVVHGMALNITVQSYEHSLDFGLMADGAAMPDVRELAEAIRVAFDDLRVLPQPGEPGHEDTADAGTVLRAARRAAGSAAGSAGRRMGHLLTDAVKGVVTGAVQAAVSQATKPARKPRPATPAKAATRR
ncbi:MAG: wax ester/triacylglycerol synthase family O-acyltransferase [Ideonella sp. WA131b]|jgi:WS/DGAT/MGAT family acyltransferase|nr:wax ester/triacylglycerol synthase family O-acyltransferase [Ideonella sp. WA131b]